VAGGQNFYGPRAFSIDCCEDVTVGNFNYNTHNIF